MSKFILVQDKMIHIPSLASISFGTNCFGYPYLNLVYHTNHENQRFYFTSWDICKKTMNKIKFAMEEVEKALANIPLTENEGQPPVSGAAREPETLVSEM